jgi:hypothetical protein
MSTASHSYRLLLRILVPFGAFFMLPRLVGAEIYSTYVLQFFFFTSATGLVTSPLEHALIRLRARPGYIPNFSQMLWAYLLISLVMIVSAGIAYDFLFDLPKGSSETNSAALLLIGVAALGSQFCYFLKFYRSDWYYYYAEVLSYLLIVTLSVLAKFQGGLDLVYFYLLTSLAYLVVVAIRLAQMSGHGSLGMPRARRIWILALRAFRSTTVPSLIGAMVKRSDSFCMPVIASSPTVILVYRLIRNVIASVSLVGSIRAQDIWMLGQSSERKLPSFVYLLVTAVMMAILSLVVWFYLMWLGVSNPLNLFDLVCSMVSMAAVVYMSLNAPVVNQVFQQGRYRVILKGSLLSLFSFLVLFVFGRMMQVEEVSYLLVVVFIPQLVNVTYIMKQVGKN